uniref:SRCR domain-containing protein n=1 Tax=Electrophorus electricus TaxID=8005 RepID=A0AAY5EH07_ELEEL
QELLQSPSSGQRATLNVFNPLSDLHSFTLSVLMGDATISPWFVYTHVRLVDGGSRCAGRVEVLHEGQWGTVCSFLWDMPDAAVVCRELDCGKAVDVLGNAHFGPGSGPIWMDEVTCSGSESTLKNCRSAGWGEHYCDHGEDAGVICSGRLHVRLVDGGGRCSGRVEVLHRGQWGTVCGAGWDMRDAAVVCRELGCGEAVDAVYNAHFGPGSRPIWMDEVTCSGSESTLKNCRSAGWGKHNCNQTNNVGIICSGVRLVGGPRCSGRVEVLLGKTWATVCDADFDQQDAEVVCRELGCGPPVEVLGAAAIGRGEGQVWTEKLQCRGNESEIYSCETTSSPKHCSHDNDVGLICSDKHDCEYSVRLVDGGGRCSGRVEVLHRGQWGTVCGAGWDMRDAAVVCRELSCGEAVDVLGNSHFGPGSGPIWMDEVTCSGSESTLKNCTSAGWGKHNCNQTNNVGIICSVRLVGGPRCSGRVEVLLGKTWTTVCDADFDQQDAEVVCRELGCGPPVEVLGAAAIGRGEGQVWTEKLQCRGNESEIYSCETTSSPKHCSHDNDVGLICSGDVNIYLFLIICLPLNFSFLIESFYFILSQLFKCVTYGSSAKGCGAGHTDSLNLDLHLKFVLFKSINFDYNHSLSLSLSLSHTLLSLLTDSVRLVDGGGRCSGRVEVLHRGQWGTVCGAGWDMRDAAVVCRELSCGEAVDVLGNSHFGPGSGPIWMDEVTCSGSESTLKNCTSAGWGKHNCNQTNNVGIICSGVRLVGGPRCSGRVEVLLGKTWTTVCDADFDQQDAEVVCRELGCGPPVEVLGAAAIGRGEGQVWTEKLQCRGNESEIYSYSVRLVNGGSRCAGRVEVLHRGQWGTVCDDDWDMRDAAVVCRELGCGEAVDILFNAHFGAGSGPIWMDDVDCSESESTLKNCRSTGWGKHNCNHALDAGVICNESEIYFCPTTSSPKHNCSHDNDVGLICSGYMSIFISFLLFTYHVFTFAYMYNEINRN